MARRSLRALAVAASLVIPFSVTTLSGTAQAVDPPDGLGTGNITLAVSDSYAGGSPEIEFELAVSRTTPEGTPVYVYVPKGTLARGGNSTGIRGLDPTIDPTPGDEFTPCATNSPADFSVTLAQLTGLADELAGHIVAIDEEHFGPVGDADGDPSTVDPLVMLVYNDFDSSYYVCDEGSYTAGYFSDTFIEQYGINTIVIDAYDWANRIGDQSDNPDGQSYLYEGVVAHELQHLLHSYSDPGELSWVDEGLADFAIFQNGYDVGGSHLTYHQVFHRETSLTRWAGGLENYGAAYTYFQYVWEQAGGNGDGTFDADETYSGKGGDLLIKLIFENAADGMAGVNAAITQFNEQTGASLRSAEALFKDWSVAIYLDDEGSNLYDIKAVDFGDPASTPWTIDLANSDFFAGRGQYAGRMPEPRWNKGNVPAQTALPFGTSYETFRNLGPTFSARLTADPVTRIAPHSGDTHWYAGYSSGADNVLNADLPGTTASPTVGIGGQVLDFWTWYFIEDGWDYGFVEALVGDAWVTVPLTDVATGAVVTTDDDPQGANTEGNGLTGTSGGEYFVDDPEYVHLNAALPAGATDVRFRYSTDQAYLDTGWFVDDVTVGGTEVPLSSDTWEDVRGVQNNEFSLQLVSSCDLTPGVTSPGEVVDSLGTHVYRLEGSDISAGGFTTCGKGNAQDVVAVISNLTYGDLDALDADYRFRLVGGPAKGAAKKKPAAAATTTTSSTSTSAKRATVETTSTAVVLGPPTGVTKAAAGPVAAPVAARTYGPPTGLPRK